jgi:hypothetical protein
LEISYETKELREIFQFPARAADLYGPKVARLLAVRFADLRASPNAEELEAFSPKHRIIQGVPALALDLSSSYSVILVPNHPKHPPGAAMNWATVRRVKVLDIVRDV